MAVVAGAQAPYAEAGEVAMLQNLLRRIDERRMRCWLVECCAVGSEVVGTSGADAVQHTRVAVPASVVPRTMSRALPKHEVQRRSLAAHRVCCGAPRACEARGSSENRTSGRCATSIIEAERSAGAAAIDEST